MAKHYRLNIYPILLVIGLFTLAACAPDTSPVEGVATGIEINKKIVCEPFSRDIRGAAPNNMDISLAQRMAYNVAGYLKAGTSRLMPAVQSGREYAIPFNEITTDNMKEEDLTGLTNRLTNNE